MEDIDEKIKGSRFEVCKLRIAGIPALIWGKPSERVYIHVHGKMSNKEAAEGFARIAQENGYQTLSFDLPQHGERKEESARCDIWNGIRDLTAIGEYAAENWNELSLYAGSLGAFFSLHAYADYHFRKCLFQSPIVDMEYLVQQMMTWFSVTPERLWEKKVIDTPVDPLSWDYWQYVKAHPIQKWESPTAILYGGKDVMQSRAVIETFTRRFQAALTVEENCEHPFMAEGDGEIVSQWLRAHI